MEDVHPDAINEGIKNLAVSVVLQAAQEAERGNVEAAYWLSCDDVQTSWVAVAGLSWSHVERWVNNLDGKYRNVRKPR